MSSNHRRVASYSCIRCRCRCPLKVSFSRQKQLFLTWRDRETFGPLCEGDCAVVVSITIVSQEWSDAAFTVKAAHSTGNRTFRLTAPSEGCISRSSSGKKRGVKEGPHKNTGMRRRKRKRERGREGSERKRRRERSVRMGEEASWPLGQRTPPPPPSSSSSSSHV